MNHHFLLYKFSARETHLIRCCISITSVKQTLIILITQLFIINALNTKINKSTLILSAISYVFDYSQSGEVRHGFQANLFFFLTQRTEISKKMCSADLNEFKQISTFRVSKFMKNVANRPIFSKIDVFSFFF